jgi:D-amino-acid dehydrogenase
VTTDSRNENVIVTGGGIIGIACAHYLVAAGYRVTVIDQAEVGKGCSHANCGFICPSHVLPLNEPGAILDGFKSLLNPRAAFRIKPQLRLDLYEWMLQFLRRCTRAEMIRGGKRLLPLLESSMDEYHKLFAELGMAGEWKVNGLLYAFVSQAAFDKFARTDKLLSETYGITARRIEGDGLPEFDPAFRAGLAGAFFYDDDGSVRPDKLVRDWRSRLLESGVDFVENCRLEQVRRSGDGIVALETTQGEMVADHYVFATGAWSRLLAKQLGCRIPVEPGKGYSLTMSKPDVCPQHPMLLPEHRIGVTPFDDGYRLGSMMEFAGYDSSIPAWRMTQLRDSARPYLRAHAGDEVQETWYGWRPMTWDSLPIIGRVPGLANGVLATGHNMLGLTLAPATGRLVTELIRERPTYIDIDAYSPNRF